MFEDIGNLFHGFAVVVQPFNLVLMVVGIVLGVIVGVLPGLGGANGVAMLLPLTFSMSPTSAIIMLSCIYWGALFGGAITSVLFNIPGEPWSVATTFDGYPMAQKGRAGEALTAAFTSSFVGALFAVIMITLVAPLVAAFALRFGPAEKFSVYFLAFCSFVGMSKEPAFKTIAAIVFTGGSRPMPTKLQNVSSCTAKNSGGPNRSAKRATSGARNVIMITANSAPTNDDVKAAVIASAARPCCAIG